MVLMLLRSTWEPALVGPKMAAVLPLTALVVARALVLNGLGGIIFGWLYWKRGLLAAMLAHFSTDVVLHVAVPLLTT